MIVAPVGLAPQPARAPRASAGFSVPAAATPSAAAAPAATMPLGAVLALQEQEAGAARDRQARKHGQALLQALSALQRALLAPGGLAAALDGLAALTQAPPQATDPALAGILQALLLRAHVELARHEA